MEDSLKTLFCPACGKEMKKIYLEELGFHVDICSDGCGGIYLDNREFKKLDEPHEDITKIEAELENKSFEPVEQENVRKCPSCGAPMVKLASSVKHEVIVDDCYSCGGKFLDYGELKKIRAEYKTEEERSQSASETMDRIFSVAYQDAARRFAAPDGYANRAIAKKSLDTFLVMPVVDFCNKYIWRSPFDI